MGQTAKEQRAEQLDALCESYEQGLRDADQAYAKSVADAQSVYASTKRRLGSDYACGYAKLREEAKKEREDEMETCIAALQSQAGEAGLTRNDAGEGVTA